MNGTTESEGAAVLDAAFELAKRAIPPLGHAEAKEKLQHSFPDLSDDRITELYLRAADLADACYDAGDQCLDKRTTDAEAIASLRERFPGFSTGTYKKALNWGYFLAR